MHNHLASYFKNSVFKNTKMKSIPFSSTFSFSIFLILSLLYNHIHISHSIRPVSPTNPDTNFIKTSCIAATYPNLCYSTLSNRASAIRSDPKILAHEALTVCLETARSTSSMMVQLSLTHGLHPRETGAMRDCVEELSDSVDELRKSLGEMNTMKPSTYNLMINDIQTWVSAAMTDEDTCSDGFAGKVMNGNLKNDVRERILNVVHLTSNALALINRYASHHG